MRALLRSMKPDSFDISAVLALYRPGPMGPTPTTTTPTGKNKRQPVTLIHPELAEPLEDILSTGLRRDRVPGTGHDDRAAGGGTARGRSGSAAPGHGARRDPTRSSARSLRDAGQRASDAAINTLWDILSCSPTTRSTTHQRGLRIISYRPLTSKPTIRPSTWLQSAGVGQGQQGQERDLSGGMPGNTGARRCRRMSTTPSRGSQRSGTRSASGCPLCATSEKVSSIHRRVAHGQGRSPISDFLSKVEASAWSAGGGVADQGWRLRLAGPHPPRPDQRARTSSGRSPDDPTGRGDRPVLTCPGHAEEDDEAGSGMTVQIRSGSGTSRCCWPMNGRCWGCTSRTTLARSRGATATLSEGNIADPPVPTTPMADGQRSGHLGRCAASPKVASRTHR